MRLLWRCWDSLEDIPRIGDDKFCAGCGKLVARVEIDKEGTVQTIHYVAETGLEPRPYAIFLGDHNQKWVCNPGCGRAALLLYALQKISNRLAALGDQK